MLPANPMQPGAGGPREAFDVVLCADLSRRGDIGFRIAQEAHTYSGLGYRVGLLHVPSSFSRQRVSPDILRCLSEDAARPVGLEHPAHARLLVVHSPQTVLEVSAELRALRADRVILVVDDVSVPDLHVRERLLLSLCDRVSVAPINAAVRNVLRDRNPVCPIEPDDWSPIASPSPQPYARNHWRRSRPTLGYLTTDHPNQWPRTRSELSALFPVDAFLDYLALGEPPSDLTEGPTGLSNWTVLSPGDIGVERFLLLVDALAFFPGDRAAELPEAALVAAMAAGKVVVLPPEMSPAFGEGALYCAPEDAIGLVQTLMEDPLALQDRREKAASFALSRFSEKRHQNMLAAMLGPGEAPQYVQSPSRRLSRRALFVASNGIGVGHVTRMLAIARRLSDHIDPIFVTLGHSARLVEAFGFKAEYIPSRLYAEAAFPEWDAWYRVELEHLIDRYDARLVVYDGAHPTEGMVHAVGSRGGTKLAWIRQGMLGSAQLPDLENSRFCDLIIEPGEIAAAYDVGVTSSRRGEVKAVGPIRLLDEDEILTRNDAAAALGLDEQRPAVLLQLGAGANRDNLAIVHSAVDILLRFPEVQVGVLEWSISGYKLPALPGTLIIRGFPISRYLKAFDFCISAAGYNAFHELICEAVPTVFVANTHPSMDDQAGRARFAQDAGAAFDLPEHDLSDLPAIVEVLLSADARAILRQNCGGLWQTNGAPAAAEALADLIG